MSQLFKSKEKKRVDCEVKGDSFKCSYFSNGKRRSLGVFEELIFRTERVFVRSFFNSTRAKNCESLNSVSGKVLRCK